MNTDAPQVRHISWLIFIVSTPSLYKLADVPQLAIEVNLISVDKAVLWTHFPKLVYTLTLNSLVFGGHECVFFTGFLSEMVVIIRLVHSEISASVLRTARTRTSFQFPHNKEQI